MTDKTISTYHGFGHRVHIIRRDAVARNYVLLDNRRVIMRSTMEDIVKFAFLNHVASIVNQTALEL